MSTDEDWASETLAVHAGRRPADQFGFVNTPIYKGSTVVHETVDSFRTSALPYTYGRRGSPTLNALTGAWSELEKADGTVLVPSGLASMTVALMAVLKAGDHLLMVDSAYQPTRHFCDGVLKGFGVETEYYDPTIGGGIEALLRDNTAAVFLESPGSVTFEVQDVPAILGRTKPRGITTLIDNTWATPLLFNPLEMGIDVSTQAGTKYLVGHADSLIGTISARGEAWNKVRDVHGRIGLMAGPDDAFLALRGLRTMPLRLREQGAAALELAEWLSQRPEIARVLHPALPSDPGHAIWKRDFAGSSGLFGVLFDPRYTQAEVDGFMNALRLFGIGASWGGYESLVIPCAPNGFRTAAPFKEAGCLVRLQIGLENRDDLRNDLQNALGRLPA